MGGGIAVLILGIWMLGRFVWILCSCDKIKGKVVDNSFRHDKYEYIYMGKKHVSYAFIPLFSHKKDKEYSIYVSRIKHNKIFSKNELLFYCIIGTEEIVAFIGTFLHTYIY